VFLLAVAGTAAEKAAELAAPALTFSVDHPTLRENDELLRYHVNNRKHSIFIRHLVRDQELAGEGGQKTWSTSWFRYKWRWRARH
jgi:hypothetical protein